MPSVVKDRYSAKARFVRFSPFKLRSLADVVRGKGVLEALHWLDSTALKRSVPVRKLVASAAANAFSRAQLDTDALKIVEIRVDEGPIIRYFKPGAMGRSNVYRKRLSHLSVIVEQVVE